jgi:Domain of unknown function (DUF6456)
MTTPVSLAAGPPPERRQHGRVGRDTAQLVDAEGGIGLPYRAESLLVRLERRGDIGARERAAGEEFQHQFRLAQLDPLHAADMGQQVRASLPQGAQNGERARRQIRAALDALGGHASPCGACAWYVLGLELSMREWSLRQGWSGRPVSREVAKGILLGTLGLLAKHFR